MAFVQCLTLKAASQQTTYLWYFLSWCFPNISGPIIKGGGSKICGRKNRQNKQKHTHKKKTKNKNYDIETLGDNKLMSSRRR